MPCFLMGKQLSPQPVENIDSLRNCLHTVSGTERVDVLNELCNALIKKSPKEAFTYAKQALSLSDSLDYNLGKSNAYYLLAGSYNPEFTIEKSIGYLKLSEQYFDSTTDWFLKYRIWLTLGRRYSDIDKYDSAVIYYQRLLSELTGNETWIARAAAHIWLAGIYNIFGDYGNELKELTKTYNLVITHFKTSPNVNIFSAFGYLEKLGGYYTRHGYYAKSIEANNRVLDSLDKFELTPIDNDYFEAKFLGHIARAYYHWGKYEPALDYHNKSLDKFYQSQERYNKLNKEERKTHSIEDWQINIANQIEGKANVQMYLGLYDSAESNFLHSLKFREEKGDSSGVAMCRDGLGELYHIQGKFTKALEQYEVSAKLKLSFNENFIKTYSEARANHTIKMINESVSITYLRIGNLYNDWDKSELALEQYNRSLKLCRDVGYIKGEAEALTAIGDIYLQQEKNNSAFNNYQNVLKLYRQIDNKPGIGLAYHKQADYFAKTNQPEKALDYYSRALVILEEIGLQRELAEIYEKKGKLYFKKGNFHIALDEFDKSISLASYLNLKKILMEAHKGISEVYTALGNTGKAFEHYKEYIAAKDSIYTLESDRQIAEIETRFETEKKEQQILILEKENELQKSRNRQMTLLIFGIVGFVIIILFIVFLYLRQNRLKAVQEKTGLQQKLLRSQMNPHFIFNSLASIQNSIINEEPVKASKYLARFSKLVRNILDSSVEEFITLEEEIVTIENYLALQKIRFPEKFDYSIDVDEEIEPVSIQIPPMLAQPFIENAIEHGIKHKDSKGNIRVRFKLNDNKLLFEVEDDGIGREKAQEILRKQDKDHKSMATAITQERIRVLNKKLKSKISLSIEDLKKETGEASGTMVRFELPVK